MKSFSLKKHTKKFLLSLFFSTSLLAAQSLQVDYYGVVSSSADSNMLKMAQDVFYTQLKSIDSIIVIDKRPDLSKTLDSIPEPDAKSSRIAFYAEIIEEQNSDGKPVWNCKFDAITPRDGITHSKSEVFESYYKILVNAKNSIEAVLNELRGPQKYIEDADSENLAENRNSSIDIESLAGTWTGEPFTDKIIILRGGRGFVVYKNGAMMNIRITAGKSDSEIEVRQTGRANASFFTEIPRETALLYAPSANPIVWNLKITSQGSLEGTKTTLITENGGASAKEGKISTVWTRK